MELMIAHTEDRSRFRFETFVYDLLEEEEFFVQPVVGEISRNKHAVYRFIFLFARIGVHEFKRAF